MAQNVIVIGGTGFLGAFAVREMRRRGWAVTSVGFAPVPQEQQDDPQVRVVEQDIHKIDEAALLQLLEGHTALVFAAGLDDRQTPPRPSYPLFHAANVEAPARLLRLAKKTSISRAVILGSYFTHFQRQWPHLKLAERHPYIRSRVEQQRVAFATAAPEISLCFLELPYIFGALPGRAPLWTPLVNYLRSTKTVFYTQGGSACVSVQAVAQAIAGAVESGQAGSAYPIGEENLTWQELLTRLAKAEGRDIRIVALPNVLVAPALWALWLIYRLQGKESGLDPRRLLDLQSANTFFDPRPAQQQLNFQGGLLNQALAETVAACPPKEQK